MKARPLAWLLTIGGGIGLLAALTLAIDKITVLGRSCGVEPSLNCGPTASAAHAAVLGLPYALVGIAGFAAISAIGVVMTTGAALPRWFWFGLQAGVTFGVVLAHWLLFQNLNRAEGLCGHCLAVCAVMIPLFWHTTVHTSKHGLLPVPAGALSAVRVLTGHDRAVLAGWYLLILTLIYLSSDAYEHNPPEAGALGAVALINSGSPPSPGSSASSSSPTSPGAAAATGTTRSPDARPAVPRAGTVEPGEPSARRSSAASAWRPR